MRDARAASIRSSLIPAATAMATAVLALAGIVGCGGHDASTPPQYALEASGGTYDDGSGQPGIAVLATLRDSGGTGPAAAWSGTISDGSGARAGVAYADGSAGSYAALWWPDLPFAAGSYGLDLQSGGSSARASFSIADGAPLPFPAVALSTDGATVSWSAVTGAAAYECRIHDGSGLVRSEAGTGTTCAVGDLPDGSYQASILAYSTDPATIAADPAQRPTLPARFDMSEGRLSFLRSGASPVVVLVAAGGAIDWGIGERTLAVWLSILNADGTPTASPWSVSVTGPGLSSPITFTYPANFSRRLLWSYYDAATPGLYTATAASSSGTFTGSFSVGAPAVLDIPTGVTAAGGAQGSATVDWTPVTGARSYLVGVWQGATFVTSQWVSAPPASFPQGSFTPGTYDVYVAATDADMTGGERPAQVAVAENTMEPGSLVVQ